MPGQGPNQRTGSALDGAGGQERDAAPHCGGSQAADRTRAGGIVLNNGGKEYTMDRDFPEYRKHLKELIGRLRKQIPGTMTGFSHLHLEGMKAGVLNEKQKE